ncbi:MAG: electron transfer flavoprotein subunit beta/FixA family protein [Sphaerochaetaceae bacterium]|jgi:electron transfer flavoprotein beta subunit|nr:electron transfer flavoprotein subunit beta/FixA family protein [Sphaerochaetaceae bacterium]MDD3669736.1 electron transfer flavoprotein subunit beta/FixA family protein [Sphaerochaetaceae bacterium]MDX9935071.1 electron transfer flavoprotein subunit beta/FixA family protein [Sphaerochaetaceae bacterium]
MRYLVLIKQVPLSSNVAIDEKTGTIKRESGEAKMNPYDLYALETALRLRETYEGVVSVLTMGPPQAGSVVRESFMMGADEGFLLTDRAFAGSDVLATSYALSQAIKHIGNIDLVICGKQTTDGDTAQVGAECSEFLNIPCISNVQRIIDVTETAITAECDTGTTVETVRVHLPALMSVEKDIWQPRLPSFKLMCATAQRPVKTLNLKDLADTDERHYGLKGSPTQVVRMFPPEEKSDYEIWNEGNLGERLYQYLVSEKFLQESV